jgi:hypothetical protein
LAIRISLVAEACIPFVEEVESSSSTRGFPSFFSRQSSGIFGREVGFLPHVDEMEPWGEVIFLPGDECLEVKVFQDA